MQGVAKPRGLASLTREMITDADGEVGQAIHLSGQGE